MIPWVMPLDTRGLRYVHVREIPRYYRNIRWTGIEQGYYDTALKAFFRLHPLYLIHQKNKEGSDTMERFLTEYINRLRPHFAGFPAVTAHEIASVFLAFKFGLYRNAVHECTQALSLIPDSGANLALKKALSIVRANAQDLENAQFTPDLSIAFSENERPYMPIILPQDQIEDSGKLELDNALILIYCVADITSPDDEEAMAEHRKFIIRLLNGYKKALGIT
jgi:hypothetical protein